jgi:putative heme-binding domain-containing protein
MRPFLIPLAVAVALLGAPSPQARAGATPAEELTVAAGFKAELLRSATPEEGSWVSMAMDGKGRLYISCQATPPGSGTKATDTWGGLFRVTLDAQGHVAQWEKVPVPVGDAMGMLWAFDSLYVSGNGPNGRGIYRLKSEPGADLLTSWALWKPVPGGNGEHGAHALALAPDGKSIYIIHGNSTPLVDGIDPASPFRHYAEDDLLPRIMDPVATFFDKVKSPYGYVLRTDEAGGKWELIAGGFRNPYDIAFNPAGDLFTYDSDMEWDVASPWYRPTRVLHIVPGGEYGFREGTAKWPESYADSLPAAVNIGLGCPTGIAFGTTAHFPEKYQKALFILDWTFGRILAVHLKPLGTSYTADNPLPSPYHLTGPASSPDVEEFVRGKGLPVTDVVFGQDGAMYFTIGGRGTQAGLYRISWTGDLPTPSAPLPAQEISPSPQDLGSADRFARFRARLTLEANPDRAWIPQVLAETDARTAVTGLLALARTGTKDDQKGLLDSLSKLHPEASEEELMLDWLRVLEVTIVRQGLPAAPEIDAWRERLSPLFPAQTFALNRELVQLLVVLGAPDVVEKTLALMDQATEPAEQIWYALCLREAQTWTPSQREHYFAWFAKAKAFRGGNSFGKFILRIRDLALEKLPEAERPALLALAEKVPQAPKPAAPVVARPFVQMWTMADLEPVLGGVAQGRDFARGKRLYSEALCAQCHLFAGTGGTAQAGAVGPDLTAVGSRFSARDILESIIEPSKIISDQYQSLIFTMNDGSMAAGQIAEENHYLLTLIVDPSTGAKQNFPKNKVVKREVSPISLMPPGLAASLTKEEVLDLLAYLQSGGNEQAPNFRNAGAIPLQR